MSRPWQRGTNWATKMRRITCAANGGASKWERGSTIGRLRIAGAVWPLGDSVAVAETLLQIGMRQSATGDHGGALLTLGEALPLLRLTGNRDGEIAGTAELGIVFLQLRRYAEGAFFWSRSYRCWRKMRTLGS